MSTKWTFIKMMNDAAGGLCGLYAMEFAQGEVYRVDLPLAAIFLGQRWAIASAIPKAGANRLCVNEQTGRASWQLVGPDAVNA